LKTRIIEIDELKDIYLPHRYPFIFVDKVLSFDDTSIVAIKNVTINEPYFQGHFPTYPVMPGVIIIETLAQTAGILAKLIYANGGKDINTLKTSLLAMIDSTKFKKQVRPGDTLVLEVKYIKDKMNIWSFECKASVDDKVACSSKISIYIS